MILVNLLPQDLRPIKRTPVPYILSVGFLIGALAAMAALYLAGLGTAARIGSELASTEDALNKLAPVIQEHNELSERKIALQDKIETIQEIQGDRKIWSEHLHKLATLTPENIWFSRIRETSQTFRETVEKRDPKTGNPVINPTTKQPEIEVRNVRKPVLEVRGYVINDAETGRANIAPLSNATDADPLFSRHFKQISPAFTDTEFNGFRVRSFTLTYQILVDNTPEGE